MFIRHQHFESERGRGVDKRMLTGSSFKCWPDVEWFGVNELSASCHSRVRLFSAAFPPLCSPSPQKGKKHQHVCTKGVPQIPGFPLCSVCSFAQAAPPWERIERPALLTGAWGLVWCNIRGLILLHRAVRNVLALPCTANDVSKRTHTHHELSHYITHTRLQTSKYVSTVLQNRHNNRHNWIQKEFYPLLLLVALFWRYILRSGVLMTIFFLPRDQYLQNTFM